MENRWEEYLEKVEKLRKNREKVPLEALKTKYRKSYNALLSEIKTETEFFIFQFAFGGLPFRKGEDSEIEAFIQRANSVLDAERAAGTFREISRAVFVEYDPEKALEVAAAKVWPRIWFEAYSPYWIRHCIRQEGGDVWNDLIEMRWHDEWCIWLAPDGRSWTLMLPPTQELVRKELEEWRSKR